MGYTVVYEQDPDGGYVVKVPALPGCVSQGDTKEEATENIKEAVALYIEHLKSFGEDIPREVDTAYIELDAA